MKTTTLLPFAALAALALSASAQAQTAPMLVNQKPDMQAAKTLTITSTDYADGGAIPMEVSSYGASRSPALSIVGAPPATKSFTILMEDPDGQREGMPILHWFAYNVPGAVTAIPGGVPAGASVTAPVAMMQGKNTSGQNAYRGPHPPKGVHHYHVEVFALDTMLPPEAGADRAALAHAMAGHILAEGELVGAFAPPASAGS